MAHAYVVSLAVELCELSDCGDSPEGFPNSDDETLQSAFLAKLAWRIVDFVFLPPENINKALCMSGEIRSQPHYCICNGGMCSLIITCLGHGFCTLFLRKPFDRSAMSSIVHSFLYYVCNVTFPDGAGKMVQCCSSKCSLQWFHEECVEICVAIDSEDWWCSEECRNSGFYIYCICQSSTAENGSMVQCELGSECRRHEWYHPSCLCLSAQQLPGTR